MNLAKKPTLAQFKNLLASCDDKAGHHKLWVDQH